MRNILGEGLGGQKTTAGDERDTELQSGALCKSLQNDSKDNSIPKYGRRTKNSVEGLKDKVGNLPEQN